MHRTFFLDMRVLADPSWWHWTITMPLLAAHLLGVPWAMGATLILCAAMAVYYLVRLRGVRPFAVQVRVAYIIWLLLGLLPLMQWMLWLALAGLVARVLIDYCLMARLLSLMWFNRTEPLTWSLVVRIFAAPPNGAIVSYRRAEADEAPRIDSCSAQGAFSK